MANTITHDKSMNLTFRPSTTAFDHAIAVGHLSANQDHPRFAGNFMYMGDSKEGALFKSINTREYLPALFVPSKAA